MFGDNDFDNDENQDNVLAEFVIFGITSVVLKIVTKHFFQQVKPPA